MKVLHTGFVLLLCFAISLSAYAVEPFVLYDDFNAAFLDPDKWFGRESGDNCGVDAVRLIQRNRLRMLYRAYGGTDSDSDALDCFFQLRFKEPAPITALQGDVRVNRVEAAGCTTNPKATYVPARLIGWFFNSATPTPGSSENDVVADIGVTRFSDSLDPPNVLRVIGRVFHFTTPDVGVFLDIVDLGSVVVREWVRLSVI
jgi:hypothetical protein